VVFTANVNSAYDPPIMPDTHATPARPAWKNWSFSQTTAVVLACFFGFLTAMNGHAQGAQVIEGMVQQIVSAGASKEEAAQLRRAWTRYHRAFLAHDAAAFDELVAKNFVRIAANGTLMNKADVLDRMRQQSKSAAAADRGEEPREDQRTVRWFGSAAVIAVHTLQRSGGAWTTYTWVRQDRWRVAQVMVAVSNPAQSEPVADVQKEIQRDEDEIDRAWLARDSTALQRLVADDFVAGSGHGKKEFIAAAMRTEETSTERSERNIRVLGNAAVGSSIITDKGIHGASGEPFTVVTRVNDVWALREGRWQLVTVNESIVRPDKK
jgi:hypothetical protein